MSASLDEMEKSALCLSLDTGIDETLSWVDANLDDLRRLPQSYIHKP